MLNAGDTALYSFFGVLMVPFLILTMADIILAGAVGILVVAVLFYLNTIPGLVSAVVYVMGGGVSSIWAGVLTRRLGGTPQSYSG